MRRLRADAFRQEQGLVGPADADRWVEQHQLSLEQFTRMMEDEARVRWVETLAEPEVMNVLLDHLRVTGQYSRLLARARDKSRALESGGLEHATLADAGVTEHELVRWYFEERLGRPAVTDAAHYARTTGFRDKDAFKRAVLREFYYLQGRGLSEHATETTGRVDGHGSGTEPPPG